jgi:hypothetical protein
MLSVLLTLVVIGVLLWALNTYVPMDGKIKTLINIVVVICVVVWLLNVFGVFGAVNVPVPQIHHR